MAETTVAAAAPPATEALSPEDAADRAGVRFLNATGQSSRGMSETFKRLADQMTTYWVNFAAKGDPNGAGLPNWPAVRDRATGRGLILGDTIATEPAPNAAKLSFFDAAFARLQARATN